MRLGARQAGTTLVEVLVGLSVFGAVAAIGMPNYLGYTESSREAQCARNRHALESAERACALDNDTRPCLTLTELQKSGYLDAKPSCASGGKYVWIVSTIDDPAYPKMGCSKHLYPANDKAAKNK